MKLIDGLFDDACSAIRSKKLTIERWMRRTGLAKGTITSILDNKKTDRSSATQISTINAVFENEERLLFHLMSKRIGMEEHELSGVRPYVGLSRYVGRHSEGSLVTGSIRIREIDGLFLFEHLPDAKAAAVDGSFGHEKSEPLHAGLVMRLGPRMHFLGLGSRYIRTLITYNSETPASYVSTGLVLTSDARNKRPLTGALFMAHESYRDFSNFEARYKSEFDERLSSEYVGILRN